MKKIFNYFTIFEFLLWVFSVIVITFSFVFFDGQNYLRLVASIVGVSAILITSKGNVFGQILMLGFCVIYGYISYGYSYYGEMITYLGMSAPMAIVAIITWLKNPFKENRAQVKINQISKRETILMILGGVLITTAFYFILRALGTNNLIISTFSVATSFVAAYLTFRRSPFFALVYSLNDLVLIVLWALATSVDITYISVVICFIAFFANDTYCFISWQKLKRSQQ